MSELYLLRHSRTAPHSDTRPDRERPLEEQGRADARALARWIAARRLRPDLVLCSPARRARETQDLIVEAFATPPELRYDNELYLADADRLLDELRTLPEGVGRVMLVGHNPGLHELAQMLSDATTGPLARRLADNLPTSGLAMFEIATGWPGLKRRGAHLEALVTPRDLGRRG
ncbi:MAG: SixA phosphatase family protein [Stellaceae bacterium]